MSEAQGRALTIGLNRLKPSRRYDGLVALGPCENDAKDMADIAKSRSFSTKTLLTRKATRAAVIAQITAAAKALQPGDIFMLSFSGHGLQVADRDRDEEETDSRDETWCLYDRELIDDELYRLWLKFKRGVRIIVFSDSCRSGTVVAANYAPLARRSPKRPKARRKPVKATVLLISASLDNESASAGQAGDPNSVFTAQLKEVWNKGRFRGGYRTFWKTIKSGLPREQTSNWYTLGPKNPKFFRQRPFTI